MIISGVLDYVIIGKAGNKIPFTLKYVNLFIFLTFLWYSLVLKIFKNLSIFEKIYMATEIFFASWLSFLYQEAVAPSSIIK